MASPTFPRAFLVLMFITALCFQSGVEPRAASAATVQVSVDTTHSIADIGDEFICATLDWWPPTKCNYGTCPWYSASLINLDLANPILEQAVLALAPLKVRLGGTLQDRISYDFGSWSQPCLPLVANSSDEFGFSGGCLTTKRWDELNQFFQKTQVSVVFGLNVLRGRASSGSWDPRNAEDFMRYTYEHGYPVIGWELGNELLGGSGVGLKISPQFYGSDVKKLRVLVDTIYQNGTKPLVIAPDDFYQVGNPSYTEFLAASGPSVVDVVTRHIYNLGPGDTSTEDLVGRILDVTVYAQGEEDRYTGLQSEMQSFPWAKTWVGESGGAYNSGHPNVTDAFIMAFWYLDQLGLASKHDNHAFCRQTLIGGHYGFLDAITDMPNPDFYGALLWQKLMGSTVLSVAPPTDTVDIRAYAHCEKGSSTGGVTLLLFNYNNATSYDVDVSMLGGQTNSAPSPLAALVTKKRKLAQEFLLARKAVSQSSASASRLLYHMSPEGGDIHSRVALLNGSPLVLTSSGQIPSLTPVSGDPSQPVTLGPLTYAFVVFQHAAASACLSR